MGSGGKNKQTTQQTTVQTPQVPSWISQPYQNYAQSVNDTFANLGDAADYTVGPSANQSAAFNMIGQPSQFQPSISQSLRDTSALTGYTPDLLRETDLAPYMNPYQRDVIDATMNDAQRFRDKQRTAGMASATRLGGVLGGDRYYVQEGEDDAASSNNLAQIIAQLRSSGFNQAQQGAMFDINSGLQGAQFRLGAASQLGQMGLAASADERARIGQMADLGAQERDIQLSNNPTLARLRLLALQGGLLGQIPTRTFTGQTSNTNGTSTSSYSPGLFNWAQLGVSLFK